MKFYRCHPRGVVTASFSLLIFQQVKASQNNCPEMLQLGFKPVPTNRLSWNCTRAQSWRDNTIEYFYLEKKIILTAPFLFMVRYGWKWFSGIFKRAYFEFVGQVYISNMVAPKWWTKNFVYDRIWVKIGT